MYKGLITVTVALAFLSLGSLLPAQAGGATSAPSKSAHLSQARYQQAQTSDVGITEFSSSSARSSTSKR